MALTDGWPSSPQPPKLREHATATGQAPRLLLLEEDVDRGRLIMRALASSYQVQLASTANDALNLLQTDLPDLLLGSSGADWVQAVCADAALQGVAVVLVAPSDDGVPEKEVVAAGAIDLADLRIRLASALARARHRSLDAAWRRALLSSLHEGVLIFDSSGEVMEMSPAFSRLFGYTMADGPFRPPYPWWPTDDEDPEQRAVIAQRHQQARAGVTGVSEALYFDAERRPHWVALTDAQVRDPDTGLTATIRTFRDITRQKEAQSRRAAAASVSADFAGEDDIASLLGLAEYGFELLFEGRCTIRLDLGTPVLFSGGTVVPADELPAQVLAGLDGTPSADSLSLRPGILLVPQTSSAGCRAWIQFPRRRQIGPDEMIVADLLAQAFALAIDRLTLAQQAADRQENLARAVESHRLIGQAVGILVERHRVPPAAAFDRLKRASQQRNLKLRALAEIVIDTGADPETI